MQNRGEPNERERAKMVDGEKFAKHKDTQKKLDGGSYELEKAQ